MSVYKLIPSHYVRLHHETRPPLPPAAAPPCTPDQFENLKLLLRASNSKLAGLAATVRELREQLQQRDATIAELSAGAAPRRTASTVVENKVEVRRSSEPQDVVVDVDGDIQVRLKVELVDRGPWLQPLVKVASSVVSRRPAAAAADGKRAGLGGVPVDAASSTSAAPGPVRGGYAGAGAASAAASPLYGSLMWRTRQRARELGYRFVWSRYGKILVKKDVQSPPMYILDEADLRKMG